MPERTPARTVDFGRMLMWLNAIVALVTIVLYGQIGGNEYMNSETIWLAGGFALQTHLALMVERRRRNPFVILLAFIFVMYYSVRLLTLLTFRYSFVFERFQYGSPDTNRALVFMIMANALLYLGLFIGRPPAVQRVEPAATLPRAPQRTLFLVVAAIVFVYGGSVLWNPTSVPRALIFLGVFLGQAGIILMAMTYFGVFRSLLSRKFGMTFVALLAAEMLLHTLAGSRSALIGSLQNVLIVALAITGAIRIRRRWVMLGVVGAPFLALALVVSFLVSTYIRAFGPGEGFSVRDALALSQQARDRLTREDALQTGLPLIFSRAGFFDYSAEVMAHRAEYARVINPPAYVRSVVDNLLTPGFDLFDQPKIAITLQFVYGELGRPSKVMTNEFYQSDQLGIYGELFVLLGYASLPFFFVIGLLFQRVYASFQDRDPFRRAIKRVVTLMTFVTLINSFGIDWLVIDLVPLIGTIYLYSYFFATRRAVAPAFRAA